MNLHRTPLVVALAAALSLTACGGGEPASTTSNDSTLASTKRQAQAATAETWYQAYPSTDALLTGVTPSANAATEGMWLPLVDWPINPIHMVMLPSGKLLSYGTRLNDNDTGTGNQDGSVNVLWNPAAGTGDNAFVKTEFSTDARTQVNSFCSSATILSSGKVLTAGGSGGGYAPGVRTASSLMSGIYSPDTNLTTQSTHKLSEERWYSTMITLADGRPILLGGMVPYSEAWWNNLSSADGYASMTPEVYQAGQGWSFLSGAYSQTAFGMYRTRNEFPHAWVAPNGEVFGISSDVMWALNPAGSGSIRMLGTFVGEAKAGTGGSAGPSSLPNVGSSTSSAVMFAPGKIIQMGGNGYWVLDDRYASSAASVVDFNDINKPVVSPTGPMNRARRFFNATVLPNGEVLATGGTNYGNTAGNNAQLAAEIWNPNTGRWRLMAAQTRARLYHNTAALLPNGAVISGGGGNPGPVFNRNAEIFLPPYLFKAQGAGATWADRPVIQGTSGFKVAHGGTLSLMMNAATPIKEVSMVGLTVVTHGFNAGQRRIPVSFAQNGNRIDLQAPNANLTPPGYYMVSVVDGSGVPSRAFVVAVGADVAAPPVAQNPMEPAKVVGTVPAPVVAPGQAASFSPKLSLADTPVSWDFGDGTPPTNFGPNQTVSHSYAAAGLYKVVLSMRNLDGTLSTESFYQMVSPAVTDYAGRFSGPMALERRSTGGDRLWVVSPDHAKVSALLTSNGSKTDITVGDQPVTVAAASNGMVGVVNKRAATISLINANASPLRVLRTVTLPRGSLPHGLVFSPDGLRGYVALEGTGVVQTFDPATGALGTALKVGGTLRHVTLSANGQYLVASRYITHPLEGEEGLKPNTQSGGGEVVVLDLSTGSVVTTIVLRHSDAPDTAVSGRGLPNYLGPLVLRPDEAEAWVPSKQDNIARGSQRDGNALDFQNTVRAVTSRVNLSTLAEVPNGRIDHDNASVASAAAFHPTGLLGFVTLETSRELAILDASSGHELHRLEVGFAPQGVLPSRDGKSAYVFNFMSRSVSVVDLSPMTDFGKPADIKVRATWTIAPAPTSNLELGKRLFYDARDTRLAKDHYMSCAACHNDGGTDGRTWDLSHAGEGLRNTPTLRGRMGTGFGNLHWTGNFDEVQDFEGQIRSLAGGTGLMTDAAFQATSAPLGTRKAGRSTALDQLATYVNSLTRVDPSPWRVSANTLSVPAQTGQQLFSSKGCTSCHSGTQFTNSSTGQLKDVGTLKPSSGKRLGGALTGLDTPTLKGAWNTGPWLHDGSAKTVEDAISAHTKLNLGLTSQELANLAAYVKEIE